MLTPASGWIHRIRDDFRILRSSGDYLSQILTTWRIGIAVVTFQLVGRQVGLAFGPYETTFENLWVGGALASLPGFLVGRAWELSNESRRASSPRPIRTMYAVLATFFTVFAVPMIEWIRFAGTRGGP